MLFLCFACSGLVAAVAKLQHVNREDKHDDVCFICVRVVYLVGLHFSLVVCFWNYFVVLLWSIQFDSKPHPPFSQGTPYHLTTLHVPDIASIDVLCFTYSQVVTAVAKLQHVMHL